MRFGDGPSDGVTQVWQRLSRHGAPLRRALPRSPFNHDSCFLGVEKNRTLEAVRLHWYALVAVGIGAAGLLFHPRRPPATVSSHRETVKVLDLPAQVEGEVELFKTELGRVVVRSLEDRRANTPHFHRHAHETWLPLSEAEATWSEGGRWKHARFSAGQVLYTPPYSISAWRNGGLVLGFVAAPEDEPTYLADVQDAADGERIDDESKWMLEKVERIAVPAMHQLGPYSRDVAVYVVSGRGQLRADGVHGIGSRQLAWIAGGTAVDVAATSPLTLLVFEPARTTVSPILKEGIKLYSQDDEELVIRDFFRDRREGFFVDVGAGHYQRDSTTFYLEERLGWSGVAIDALAEYAEDYRTHRKRTTFVNRLNHGESARASEVLSCRELSRGVVGVEAACRGAGARIHRRRCCPRADGPLERAR